MTSPTNTLTCANPTGAVTCDANFALMTGNMQNNDMSGQNNVTINYLSRLRPNSATGTATGKLVKYVGTPSTVQTIAITDTGSGIVVGGCVAAAATAATPASSPWETSLAYSIIDRHGGWSLRHGEHHGGG